MEEEKKCCGNCCWFCNERTEGDGDCIMCPVDFWIVHCDSKSCDKYINRQKVRHSAAVLAQYRRFQRALTLDRGNSIPGVLVPFDGDKISEAIEIITRYVNVITKKV